MLKSGPTIAGLVIALLMAAIQFANFASSDRLSFSVFDAYQRAAPLTFTHIGSETTKVLLRSPTI